jgi:hypothetical protein
VDVIFVMEKTHRNKLLKQFRKDITNQKIVVLGITDDFEYMDVLYLAGLFGRTGNHGQGVPGLSSALTADTDSNSSAPGTGELET